MKLLVNCLQLKKIDFVSIREKSNNLTYENDGNSFTVFTLKAEDFENLKDTQIRVLVW